MLFNQGQMYLDYRRMLVPDKWRSSTREMMVEHNKERWSGAAAATSAGRAAASGRPRASHAPIANGSPTARRPVSRRRGTCREREAGQVGLPRRRRRRRYTDDVRRALMQGEAAR